MPTNPTTTVGLLRVLRQENDALRYQVEYARREQERLAQQLREATQRPMHGGPHRCVSKGRVSHLERRCTALASRLVAAVRERQHAESAEVHFLLRTQEAERRFLRGVLCSLLPESEVPGKDLAPAEAVGGSPPDAARLSGLAARVARRVRAAAADAALHRAGERSSLERTAAFVAEVQRAVEDAARRVYTHAHTCAGGPSDLMDACDALRACHRALGDVRRLLADAAGNGEAEAAVAEFQRELREMAREGARSSEELARRLAEEIDAHRHAVRHYEARLRAAERELVDALTAPNTILPNNDDEDDDDDDGEEEEPPRAKGHKAQPATLALVGEEEDRGGREGWRYSSVKNYFVSQPTTPPTTPPPSPPQSQRLLSHTRNDPLQRRVRHSEERSNWRQWNPSSVRERERGTNTSPDSVETGNKSADLIVARSPTPSPKRRRRQSSLVSPSSYD